MPMSARVTPPTMTRPDRALRNGRYALTSRHAPKSTRLSDARCCALTRPWALGSASSSRTRCAGETWPKSTGELEGSTAPCGSSTRSARRCDVSRPIRPSSTSVTDRRPGRHTDNDDDTPRFAMLPRIHALALSSFRHWSEVRPNFRGPPNRGGRNHVLTCEDADKHTSLQSPLRGRFVALSHLRRAGSAGLRGRQAGRRREQDPAAVPPGPRRRRAQRQLPS